MVASRRRRHSKWNDETGFKTFLERSHVRQHRNRARKVVVERRRRRLVRLRVDMRHILRCSLCRYTYMIMSHRNVSFGIWEIQLDFSFRQGDFDEWKESEIYFVRFCRPIDRTGLLVKHVLVDSRSKLATWRADRERKGNRKKNMKSTLLEDQHKLAP